MLSGWKSRLESLKWCSYPQSSSMKCLNQNFICLIKVTLLIVQAVYLKFQLLSFISCAGTEFWWIMSLPALEGDLCCFFPLSVLCWYGLHCQVCPLLSKLLYVYCLTLFSFLHFYIFVFLMLQILPPARHKTNPLAEHESSVLPHVSTAMIHAAWFELEWSSSGFFLVLPKGKACQQCIDTTLG